MGRASRHLIVFVLLTSAAPLLPAGGASEAARPATNLTRAPDNFQVLVQAAKREGQLNLIGEPRDYMGYGSIIEAFSREYGIRVRELSPGETASGQLEALRAGKALGEQGAPDIVDVDVASAERARTEGLLAPYRVRSWDGLAAPLRDPDGHWWAAAYGILVLEVNAGVIPSVPRDWDDLGGAAFAGAFALGGDVSSSCAAFTVAAAALARGGGLDDPQPGLAFFAELQERGNLVPLVATADTVASGATPVTACWDYDALADQAGASGARRISIVVPASGTVANVSALAVSATAPHPMAARLWMEFLASDAGQVLLLRGHAHPSRLADLEARGALPADAADFLPASLAGVVPLFPTAEQEEKLVAYTSSRWEAQVVADSALRGRAAASPTAPSGTVVVSDVRLGDVLPAFPASYDDQPLGSVTLENKGRSVATGLTVEFMVRGFMAERKICGTIDRLEPGGRAEMPLYGLFAPSVLALTEGARTPATITVRWTAGGKDASSETVRSLRILRRNSITWDDSRRAAAFVTASDPVVMKFAKLTAAVAAARGVDAVPEPLLKAMAVGSSLAALGVCYVADPQAPYGQASLDPTVTDYVQFPAETLDYRGGDCDDLAVLYCALLEAVGVQTAFVTVPGHLYAAVSLGMGAAEARALFPAPDDLVMDGGGAWLPLETTAIGRGFLEAWRSGAAQWRLHAPRGEAQLLRVRDAWAKYEPVTFPGSAIVVPFPAGGTVTAAFEADLDALVLSQIAGRVSDLERTIAASPGTPAPLNALGVLYARFGRSARAEEAFRGALSCGEYVPALVNMGNLALLAGDARGALAYYERALAASPRSGPALLAAARAQQALENYGTARDLLERLGAADRALASEAAPSPAQAGGDRGTEAGTAPPRVTWAE